MRPTKVMPPRKLFLALLFLIAALAVMAACGGGDDDDGGNTFDRGQLTDPQTVPTVTPWQQLPDPILLDPNNIQPLPPTDPNSQPAEPTASPEPGEPGVCGETYTVVAGDTTFGIADKCGVDAQAIIDANPDIDPASLSPGDVLILPEASAETDGPEATDEATG